MFQELSQQLKNIQEEVSKNNFSIERLEESWTQARKSFDESVEGFKAHNKIIKKVKVPKKYIKLWKTKSKQVEIKVNWRYVLSIPFIYGIIFPALIFHFCIEVYQQVCFRLYGIPRVDYKEYFIYDRKLLSWLNLWEKINCIYCSYVNNLIRYSSEIGGRTERYWCPIKYYRRIKNTHSQYDKFVGGSNPKKMRKEWQELRNFNDLERK